MMANTTHPLVMEYLAQLEQAATRLSPEDARELLADIEEHFDAAERDGQTSDAQIRTIIDRLGTPESLVNAAAPATAAAVTPDPPRREGPAVALLLAAEILALTVLFLPIGVVVWIVGLIMVALSRRWSSAQRSRAFLVLGSGFPVASLAVVGASLAVFQTSREECATSPAGETTCTVTGGVAPWLPWVVAMLAVGYAVLQIVVARRLLAAVGEHGAKPRGLRMR